MGLDLETKNYQNKASYFFQLSLLEVTCHRVLTPYFPSEVFCHMHYENRCRSVLLRLNSVIRSPEFLPVLPLPGCLALNVSSFSGSLYTEWGCWFVSSRIDEESAWRHDEALSPGPGTGRIHQRLFITVHAPTYHTLLCILTTFL